jgi:LDH2 family malate/lactate/ureidoglycolate dehydrogenase
VAAQRDECYSHGLYRLLGCVRTIKAGKIDPNAVPVVDDAAPGIVRVDANLGYSLLAFETGLPKLVSKTRQQGIAAMAITRCFHFSALWPEVEAIADAGLVALALTPSHSWVAPAGGIRPAFGTNPLAFGWPRPDTRPFVFDFATSAAARGEIELHRRAGRPLPIGWAINSEGQDTTDPTEALQGAMLTFGGHKGSALSAMIELLAGPLIGDMMSTESMAFDEGAGVTPCHGELIIALDPHSFLAGGVAQNLQRAEGLFRSITDQGARLPSQRRYEARDRNEALGIPVQTELLAELERLLLDLRT